MGNHPSLMNTQDTRSEWEQEQRENFCARDLREEYRQSLYSEKGLELIKATENTSK